MEYGDIEPEVPPVKDAEIVYVKMFYGAEFKGRWWHGVVPCSEADRLSNCIVEGNGFHVLGDKRYAFGPGVMVKIEIQDADKAPEDASRYNNNKDPLAAYKARVLEEERLMRRIYRY